MRISDWSSDVCSSDLPYRRMRVWDAAGGGELKFDADAFGRRELGWIVENGLLVDRLWAALPAAGVRVHCPARVVALEDRKSVVSGKSVSGRVDLGGRRVIKKKKRQT